jgi:hypothetical protein
MPEPNSCADHYLCYKVKATTIFTPPPAVHLVDDFEDVTAEVRKLRALCTPASKNGEPVTDAVTHLEAYQIKTSPKHVRQPGVVMVNQLGSLTLSTVKPDLLLVPANKALSTDPAPPAPDENAISVNHYKCYKAKATTPFTPVQVSVSDQFTAPKLFDLRKVRHLCTPVDKNSEGVKNSDAHLVCYQAKSASGQPKHVRQTGVQTNDQFGPLVLGTVKERELCIPSVRMQ